VKDVVPHYAEAIAACLRRSRYAFTTEEDLQQGIASALQAAKIDAFREFEVAAGSRIDFFIGGGIGIEVKIRAALSALTRQLHRYAQSSHIEALILATPSLRLARGVPSSLCGKPIVCVVIDGGAL
jgi:hypothetical protein